ncbi:MAG: IS1380 family transposase [Bacteroidales bacterium]|nr:IS1380 family transposase [Bacteroidales bacterium]
MKQNTKQMMLFKDIFHKKVVADFNGGDVSSDAGLLFLREVESRVKIIRRMTDVLKDRRHPGYVKHQFVHLMKQRVFQIASGYEDANDSDELRNDPIMKIVCEKQESSLASQPTMSRFENSLSRTDLYRIAQTFVDVFIDSYKKPPEGIILDIDDTDDPTHGSQQLSFFNAYHGSYCYMPLHIYEGQSGKLITTILRTGKRPSGKEIVMILKRIVERIRKAWPHVGIIVRGDSHYGCPDLFTFCESLEIKYVFGLTSRKPMVKKAQSLSDKAKELFNLNNEPVKLFGEFTYQANSWKMPQRIICKAEHNDKGSNLRFIVTNLENNNRRMIYEIIYCGRGAMELMIKEHKNHLRSDKTSCSSFLANQFRLFIHSMAYVLLHAFREKCLKSTQFSKAQFDTIRLKILKLGVRVMYLRTKIKIHLPSSCPYQEDLFRIWQSCVT